MNHTPTNPCEGCGEPVYDFNNPCAECEKARHRAILTLRCGCIKRLQRPRIVGDAFYAHVICDRCFGVVTI